MTKLLNCPFCGGEAEIVYYNKPCAGALSCYVVKCKNCHFTTDHYYTAIQAISKWNWWNEQAQKRVKYYTKKVDGKIITEIFWE